MVDLQRTVEGVSLRSGRGTVTVYGDVCGRRGFASAEQPAPARPLYTVEEVLGVLGAEAGEPLLRACRLALEEVEARLSRNRRAEATLPPELRPIAVRRGVRMPGLLPPAEVSELEMRARRLEGAIRELSHRRGPQLLL